MLFMMMMMMMMMSFSGSRFPNPNGCGKLREWRHRKWSLCAGATEKESVRARARRSDRMQNWCWRMRRCWHAGVGASAAADRRAGRGRHHRPDTDYWLAGGGNLLCAASVPAVHLFPGDLRRRERKYWTKIRNEKLAIKS